MFTRRHLYKFSVPKDHLKYRLIGNHVTIHDLDFEVLEEDQDLSIKPAIEEEFQKKALPVTHVAFREKGNKTEIVITSSMRAIDAGGQIVSMTFCIFFMIGSFSLAFTGGNPVITVVLCTVSMLVFVFFLMRLQLGYFDYIRKIRTYIKRTSDQITTDVRREIFKHKRK